MYISTAFADDTVWIGNNHKEMNRIVTISSSFYKLNDIKINGDKSELLVWNAPKAQPAHLRIGSDNSLITANRLTKESRYLGIFIRSRAGSSHVVKRVQNEISSICNLLRHKKMTVAQLVYVNNRVLLARIEYWTKTTFLSESQCKSFHNRFIKLLKNKMRIVS